MMQGKQTSKWSLESYPLHTGKLAALWTNMRVWDLDCITVRKNVLFCRCQSLFWRLPGWIREKDQVEWSFESHPTYTGMMAALWTNMRVWYLYYITVRKDVFFVGGNPYCEGYQDEQGKKTTKWSGPLRAILHTLALWQHSGTIWGYMVIIIGEVTSLTTYPV